MNGYNYYSSHTAASSSNLDTTMILLIVVSIFFAIMLLWMMIAVINMSHSLKDIRDTLQKHFIISDTTRQPEPKNIETAKQTTSNQQ